MFSYGFINFFESPHEMLQNFLILLQLNTVKYLTLQMTKFSNSYYFRPIICECCKDFWNEKAVCGEHSLNNRQIIFSLLLLFLLDLLFVELFRRKIFHCSSNPQISPILLGIFLFLFVLFDLGVIRSILVLGPVDVKIP